MLISERSFVFGFIAAGWVILVWRRIPGSPSVLKMLMGFDVWLFAISAVQTGVVKVKGCVSKTDVFPDGKAFFFFLSHMFAVLVFSDLSRISSLQLPPFSFFFTPELWAKHEWVRNIQLDQI